MKEATHEKMEQDEVEYSERGARSYAVCCSQRDLDDENELRGAFLAGFRSACAYLRSPGIGRAAIVIVEDDAGDHARTSVCHVDPVSSRMCTLGTKGCAVEGHRGHGGSSR